MERPFPRGARWLIGCYLALITLSLAAGSGAALVMGFELWDAAATLAEETYLIIFSTHSLTMHFGVLLPGLMVLALLVVSSALRPARSPTLLLGFAGLVVWIASLVPLAAGLPPRGDFWDILVDRMWLSFPLMVASLVLTLIHVLAMLGPGRPRPTAWLAAAGTIGPIAWVCLRCTAVLWSDATMFVVSLESMAQMRAMYPIAACAALPYFIEKAGGRWPGSTWFAALIVAVAVVPQLGVSHWAPALAGMLALWIFALSALRSVLAGRTARDRTPGPLLLVAFAVVPALVLYAPLRAFLSQVSPDVPLHDTYADVARAHLGGAIFVVALIVGVQACWPELATRACSPRLARASAVLLGPGILLTTVAMWMAGTRGMARRYHAYDPDFETLHRLIGVGGLLAIAGGVLAIAALAGPRVIDPRARATGQIFE